MASVIEITTGCRAVAARVPWEHERVGSNPTIPTLELMG